MACFGEKFLFFSTNPRNPLLLPGIIDIIRSNGLDSKEYNHSLQKKFYYLYANSSIGNISVKSKDPAFSGRQLLTRAPQALGLLITQNKKLLRITEAGHLISEKYLFEDIFLHQLLKFQLPSPLHKTKKGKNDGLFNIKPFLELIRLVYKLGYLTYSELEIFGMTLTDYNDFNYTFNLIKQYRKKRNSIKGKKSLKMFDKKVQIKLFRDLYKDQITSNDLSVRENNQKSLKKFQKTKLNNWKDYTDAIFRALKATGLFVITKGRSLSISNNREEEVIYILNNIKRKPERFNKTDFYNYLSNPNIPYLLYDDKEELIIKLKKLGINYNNDDGIFKLKQKIYKYLYEQRRNQVNNQAIKLKKRYNNDILDILDMYNKIKNKDITDRPTMYEWNTWRAMTMINHGKIEGNFKVDDQGMPISVASGGQGDIVCDYDDFKIVVEVTLSTGKKQYDMENEPVNRHVGELKAKSNVPVFGIFIADKLNSNIINFFYTITLINSSEYKGQVNVIPMDTNHFTTFFKNSIYNDISSKSLLDIHNYSVNKAKDVFLKNGTEKDWYKGTLKYINHNF